ncbi:MAG: hypothetical protein MZV70_59875 [Desulfobacterales bacterium]|nr:hypothetical protein [Desulfobacterales bacterium]
MKLLSRRLLLFSPDMRLVLGNGRFVWPIRFADWLDPDKNRKISHGDGLAVSDTADFFYFFNAVVCRTKAPVKENRVEESGDSIRPPFMRNDMPLIHLSTFWLIVINSFAWFAIQISVGYFATRIRDDRFKPHNRLFRTRAWGTEWRILSKYF